MSELEPNTANTAAGEARASVLVVEADTASRERARAALSERYALRFAAGLEEALRVMTDQRPDLVVSEVDLADGTGFDLCQRIRRDAAWRNLPILLLTMRASAADKVRGFQAGADDYVVKPVADHMLRARLLLLSRIKSIEPPLLLGEVS